MDERNPVDEITTEDLIASGSKPVNRRLVMAGVAGIGAAALIATRFTGVQASDDEDDDESDDKSDDDYGTMMNPEQEAAMAALYQVFLTSVSTELGVDDTARVDLAIRNGLKAVVDQRFADGNISANRADDRKAAIEASAVPICLGWGWDDDTEYGRSRGSGGGSSDDSSDDSQDDSNDDDSSDDDVTPTPKP